MVWKIENKFVYLHYKNMGQPWWRQVSGCTEEK